MGFGIVWWPAVESSIVGGDAHPGTLTSMAPSTSLALASLLRDQGKCADAARDAEPLYRERGARRSASGRSSAMRI
ncbi:hypothetical protein RI054_33g130200 [Pseudoscourfieldia marina]